jgi:hypothetical protein
VVLAKRKLIGFERFVEACRLMAQKKEVTYQQLVLMAYQNLNGSLDGWVGAEGEEGGMEARFKPTSSANRCVVY